MRLAPPQMPRPSFQKGRYGWTCKLSNRPCHSFFKLSETPATEVVNRFTQLLLGVHHKWAVVGYGLIQGLTVEQERQAVFFASMAMVWPVRVKCPV